MAHTVIDSPVGPLTLVASNGALTGLYMAEHRYGPSEFGTRDDDTLPAAAEQLAAYFAGELRAFDLTLAPRGTPFQQRVWAALREVPYGETVTYGELAATIGRPTASRAVGHANGHNPISIIVPCHRVVGSAGDLTGYGGGLPRKRFLLDLERSSAQLPLSLG
jgi:methylated-DNA-[protein]-cysteine S-methyltransferase